MLKRRNHAVYLPCALCDWLNNDSWHVVHELGCLHIGSVQETIANCLIHAAVACIPMGAARPPLPTTHDNCETARSAFTRLAIHLFHCSHSPEAWCNQLPLPFLPLFCTKQRYLLSLRLIALFSSGVVCRNQRPPGRQSGPVSAMRG